MKYFATAPRRWWVFVPLAIGVVLFLVPFTSVCHTRLPRVLSSRRHVDRVTVQAERMPNSTNKRMYEVYWHKPIGYLSLRPKILHLNFSTCQFSNCKMNFDLKKAPISDAVLFDGRAVPKELGFERPSGQIWIFVAHEAPISFMDLGGWWKRPPWKSGFNWTMTYDKTNADIFLPYGEILSRGSRPKRNFTAIALKKTKGALLISSHCPTRGKREEYVKLLQKYIPVETLGVCGRPWKCGKTGVHDSCFSLLNTTYRFFLAFENALCREYLTEKFYDNFDYDIITVVRGGLPGSPRASLPRGTYINTNDFKSIEQLGRYLQRLSSNHHEYADFLAEKSKYYSPGYKTMYQRALCDLCERLNHREMYRQQLDIVKWAYKDEPCRNVSDLH